MEQPQLASPKARWREHELILATVICVLSIAGYLWNILDSSSVELDKIYGEPFYNNNVPFSYARNVFLPRASIALLLYLCFLQMNFFILPRLLQTDSPVKGTFTFHFARAGGIEMKGDAGAVLKRTLWAIVYTIILVLLLGAGWGLATYYENAYAYFIPGNEVDSRQIIL